MITWLNKEINEAQLGRGAYATTPTAAFTPVSSPSSSVPNPKHSPASVCGLLS